MSEGDATPDEQEIIWPPPLHHQVQPNLDKRNRKLSPKAAPFIALSGAVPALINCFHFNLNFHHVKMILEGGWIILIVCVGVFIYLHDKSLA